MLLILFLYSSSYCIFETLTKHDQIFCECIKIHYSSIIRIDYNTVFNPYAKFIF